MSNSLRPHELQHARPPCPSPTPGVHSDSRPSSQWCHPAISSSVVSFSCCPQPLPASESFPMSQLFAWGGQSTGVSALALFLPKNLIIFILLMRKLKQRESKQLTYGHLEKVELGFKHRESWYRICALYHKQCCFLYNSDSKTLRFKPWLDYVLTE